MNRYMLTESKFHRKKTVKCKYIKVKGGKVSKRDGRSRVLIKSNKLFSPRIQPDLVRIITSINLLSITK